MVECKIAGLTRFPARGESGLPETEMRLVSGHGVFEDPKRGEEKQVSLLSSEARHWVQAQSVSGLCFKRFRENILIDGLPDGLKCGALLSIGDAVLQVTAGKECFDECHLHSNGAPCSLSRNAVFASVEQDGVIRIGDSVCISSCKAGVE